MLVALEEMKEYLRVDFSDEAGLLAEAERAKTAVMYAAAYLYEHREEADHRELLLTLRALLFGIRAEEF